MIEIAVVLEETHKHIGIFKFNSVPRAEETIHIPWAEDPDGLRIFVVEDVWHYANATPTPVFVGDASIALLVRELE